MKPIYCPVCAEEMDMEKGCLKCPKIERTLKKSTTEWILKSLKNVKAVDPVDPNKNSDEDYYCPNCRTSLNEYDDNGRYYRCNNCGLSLRAMSHFNFSDIEELHHEQDN